MNADHLDTIENLVRRNGEVLIGPNMALGLVAAAREVERLRALVEACECEPPEDRWICAACGGCWSDPSDDLTVGMRYRCVNCGEVTTATSPRPWVGAA